MKCAKNGEFHNVKSSAVAYAWKVSQVLNKTKGIGIVLYDRIMENAKEMK